MTEARVCESSWSSIEVTLLEQVLEGDVATSISNNLCNEVAKDGDTYGYRKFDK